MASSIISRRAVLRVSMLAAAGMAAGLAGCAPGRSSAGGSSAAASASASATAASASASASALTSTSASASKSDGSTIEMRVNGATLAMRLADTEAASALAASLRDAPILVDLHPYGGFEKVGALPNALPSHDEQITTEPGDVMLYQGSQITIFHGSNTWAYTPLGHIEGATAESLLAAFGEGDATVELRDIYLG